jgi:pimeloyl-ACP methyl ester carboxylesterase
MNQHRLLLFIILLLGSCASQMRLQFDKHIVSSGHNNSIYYRAYPKGKVTSHDSVLLYLTGSGRFPAQRDFGMGADVAIAGYSVIYPQKSHIESDSIFHLKDGRDQRLRDSRAVINDLIDNGVTTIVLMAASEGTFIAPSLALEYPNHVKGMICLAGGLKSFRNDILYAAKHSIGAFRSLSVSAAKKAFADIAANPDDSTRFWFGHTYRFWSGYLNYVPAFDVEKLNIPVLYMNGTGDEIDRHGQDGEVLRLQSKGINLHQIWYTGVGHNLGVVSKQLGRDILDWGKQNGLF